MYPWNGMFWEAFQRLIYSRQTSQSGYGHIPLSEITDLADKWSISDLDALACWIKMITALDTVYVRYMNRRLKEEMERKRKAAELKQARRSPRLARRR